MNFDDQFAQLKSQLAICEQEMNSLKAGRKSAAPRLRKSLMALKTGSHTLRASTTGFVRDMPTKSRKKVVEAEPEEAVESAPVEEVAQIKPEKSMRVPRKKKVEVEE